MNRLSTYLSLVLIGLFLLGTDLSALDLRKRSKFENQEKALDKKTASKTKKAKRVLSSKKRRANRKLASIHSSEASVYSRSHKHSSIQYLLGVSGGFASASLGATEESADGSSAQTGTSQTVYYFGLGGQVTSKYLGVELDTYLLYGPGKQVGGSETDGSDATARRSMRQFGALADLQAKYPIHAEEVLIRPRIGVGYGLISQSVKHESVLEGSEDVLSQDSKFSVSGIYGLVGLDVRPIPMLTLSADIATSISASGKLIEETVDPNDPEAGTVETKAEKASFTRMRIGAFYALNPSTQLGAQFLVRGIDLGVVDPDSLKLFLVSVWFGL